MSSPKQQQQAEDRAHQRAAAQSAPRRVRSNRNKKAAAVSTAEVWHGFHAVPEYLRDNEYIKAYYRPSMPVRDSIRSLFGLHNETGNIYTHLIGFMLFLFLTIYVAREPPTPLAIGSKQVELLWHTAQGKLQQLRSGLSATVLPTLPTVQQITHNLQHLQEGLSERVAHMGEGLADHVAHLSEELSETVHHIQEGLSEGVHWIQGGLQGAASMPLAAAAAANKTATAAATAAAAAAAAAEGLGGPPHSHLVEALKGLLLWPTARWPTYVFMGGAMTCLLLSAVCHLLGCCQKHISQFVWRLDYAGIAILIVSSFYPPVYYGFMCHRFFLGFYLITISTMGCGVILVSLADRFQKREWRAFRAAMFSGLGLYGLAPVIHQWLLNHDVPQVKKSLWYMLVMGATYLSGGAIYALRIPERWFPGKFDLFLHSHQIFHLAVVAGACIHYYAVKLLLEWRDASGGCAAPVVSGSVSSVLQQMRDLGHDLFSIDEVWSRLQHYMQQHT